jgi:putative ABC transport system permease protein
LRANWFRGLLTALGIVIGVAALVDLTAVSGGAQADVAASLRRLGPNVLVTDGQPVPTNLSDITITPADVEALHRLPFLDAVAPYQADPLTVSSGRFKTNTMVMGMTPTFAQIHNYAVRQGRGIIEADVRFGRSVIVLGQKPLHRLFPTGGTPVGRTIRIGQHEFEVVGVLERKGKLGQDNLDDQAFVPLPVAKQALFGSQNTRSVDVRVRQGFNLTLAMDQMASLFRRLHRLAPAAADNFSTEDQASIVKTAQSATKTFRILTLALGVIALLVGGIGIMNIMLVSVTERTREIGIRKAIGATPRRILRQFVIEAVVLSTVGGVLGMAAGIGVAQVVTAIVGWPTVIGAGVLGLASGVSIAVGLVFGSYPARRAARLEPLAALRYE